MIMLFGQSRQTSNTTYQGMIAMFSDWKLTSKSYYYVVLKNAMSDMYLKKCAILIVSAAVLSISTLS